MKETGEDVLKVCSIRLEDQLEKGVKEMKNRLTTLGVPNQYWFVPVRSRATQQEMSLNGMHQNQSQNHPSTPSVEKLSSVRMVPQVPKMLGTTELDDSLTLNT